MKNIIKMISTICLVLVLLFSISGTIEAAYYDAISVQPISQGTTNNSYSRSFIVPAVSYSSGATRRYAVRILSGNNSAWTDKKQYRVFVDSNAKATYTFAALYGGDGTTGTAILGKDGQSFLAISGYNKNIATYSGHLFSTKTRKSYGMGKQ